MKSENPTGFSRGSMSVQKYLFDAGFTDIGIVSEYEAHDMTCLLATAIKP